MKPQVMRAFLEEFFAQQNAKTELLDRQILHVRAPRKLAGKIGGSSLRLAFSPGALKTDPTSELAMVGNPVFDRILDLARESGRVGERFISPPSRPTRVSAPPKQLGLRVKPAAGEKPDKVYTPCYFFLFRIEFTLEEIPDTLETVELDGVTMDGPNQTPDLGEYWDSLEVKPVVGREVVPAFPVPEAAIRAAMEVLELRLRKRIGRLKRVAQESLEKETRSISDYYQQLIDETRNASRRWVLPPGGKEERIRLLQLDWRRRSEEAADNWRPRAEVTLVAVGAVQRPRLRYRLEPLKTAGLAKPSSPAVDTKHCYWDEVDKVFVVPIAEG